MNLQLILLGLLLITAPATLTAGSLTPARTVAQVCRFGFLSGLVIFGTGLVMTAIPTALRWSGLPHIGDICERVFVHTYLDSSALGMAAGGAAIWIVLGLSLGRLAATRRHAELQVDDSIGVHLTAPGCSLVILPSSAHVAYANGGRDRQIVISSGLLRSLSREQRRIVLLHEMAHIRHNHRGHLAALHAVGRAMGWVPGVRKGLSLWRESLERWADDDVRDVGADPEAIWATIVRAATLSVGVGLAFADVGSLDARRRYLMRGECRLEPIVRGTIWMAITIPVGLAASVIAMWALHTHQLVALAPICPI